MCETGKEEGGDGRKESKVSLSGGFNSIIIMGRHPLWDLEHIHFFFVFFFFLTEDVHRSYAAEEAQTKISLSGKIPCANRVYLLKL